MMMRASSMVEMNVSIEFMMKEDGVTFTFACTKRTGLSPMAIGLLVCQLSLRL